MKPGFSPCPVQRADLRLPAHAVRPVTLGFIPSDGGAALAPPEPTDPIAVATAWSFRPQWGIVITSGVYSARDLLFDARAAR